MNFLAFIDGIIIGFVAAVPTGPLGILIIQKTLLQGRLHGFISGLGVATADAIYGTIAVFGITVVSGFIDKYEFIITIIGGTFLTLLGIKIFKKKTDLSEMGAIKKTNFLKDYTSSFFLTLTNPLTIIIFASVASRFSIVINDISYSSVLLTISGIFTGSALWFTGLSTFVGMFKNKFSPFYLKWINQISGIIIIVIALFAFLRLSLN